MSYGQCQLGESRVYEAHFPTRGCRQRVQTSVSTDQRRKMRSAAQQVRPQTHSPGPNLLARTNNQDLVSLTNFVDVDHSNEPSLKFDAEAVSLASSPLPRVVANQRLISSHGGGNEAIRSIRVTSPIRLNLERTHRVRGACGSQQQTSSRHSTQGDRNGGHDRVSSPVRRAARLRIHPCF